ncbi:acetate kinase [Quadrisphaera granulorum]|uniref:Acetate kinase n=1 Tax=Quadrisphaera granulorum TaxID=317664 RepID=A0A316A7U6_9ACTN|nr:acetate/propionate family kinase [Quadrisphaera granulorum]PWJ53785.1 acetate kinase [Quadrisphaera granulorum]SZE96542.1 acetate kinase [Quadrisphaera granulorum]
MSRVLVVNAGSSSLKYQLREHGAGAAEVLAKGTVERIGSAEVPDHAAALSQVMGALSAEGGGPGLEGLAGVGHRVVQGGTRYTDPTVVDDDVERGIDELSALAPLHNPPQLAAIRALRKALPDVPQVAVFDTAFHATIPARAATYAVDVEVARRYGLRKYGFHGTSVQVVTKRAAAFLGVPLDEADLVVAHVGNGVSVTAVQGGRSVDTTMGLTPLAGAAMGTRSGDVDPAIVMTLVREAGMTAADVDDLLNKRSGLKGLTGESDVRAVQARADAGDAAARAALEVYCYRLSAAVGSFLALVPRVKAVVFTAGVGENAAAVRAAVCAPLEHLGFGVDAALNEAARGPAEPVRIGARVVVVPTDEEAEIADQVLAVVTP